MWYFVFDIHNEHKCVAVFYRLHDQLPAQGELDDGTVIKPIALPRVMGCLWSIVGHPEGG